MADIFVAQKHKEKDNIKKEIVKVDNASILSTSKSMSAFSTFCVNPIGVSFQTQKSNEIILLFLRAHFITNISWIIASLILAILPLIIAIFLPNLGIDFLSSPQAARFTTVYVFFYYLILSSYIFISFLHWFYNVFLVTTERVVDIDYSDIVVHNIAITNLNHIEDVHYTQYGFIPTLLNYGNLFAQTAGEEKNFEALSVPKPREASHIIGDLIGK